MAAIKKIVKFSFPDKIISNYEGYEFLSNISLLTFSIKSSEVIFNFSNTVFFQENLCSPLGALLAGLKERGNEIKIEGISNILMSVFEKNGFNSLLNPNYDINHITNTIDFKKFTLQDTVSFQTYINDKLLGRADFPHVSDLLRKKINKSILELFNNAHSHGRCEFVYICGQYSTTELKLHFTISDMGTTIRKNVNNYFGSGSKITGKDAIAWAVEKGNTTKRDNIPGGLGLSLIRDFLSLNKGSIQIISSNGYWEEKNGAIFGNTFKARFLGTIVNLEFNLNDKNTYILASEIDPKTVL